MTTGSANAHETGTAAKPRPATPKLEALELVVKETRPNGNGSFCWIVDFEGHAKWRVKYKTKAEFASLLVPGAKAMGEIERVPSDDPKFPDPELWLRKWDGIGERKGARGGGGGNFRPQRTEAENLTMCACNAMTQAGATSKAGDSPAEVANRFTTLFEAMVGAISGAKGRIGA